uniref:Hydroperoxide isomerase ALOXE3-like n=1 Tax=Echeneis naucrates TaxID=173247 RepID=A0A665W4G4_ECHNA
MDYKVTVHTTSVTNATNAITFTDVFIKLVGTEGESDRTRLLNPRGTTSFHSGAVSVNFTVSYHTSLGKLFLIEVDQQDTPDNPEHAWFPARVEVKSPDGETYHFPIHRRIIDSEVQCFRERTALKFSEETQSVCLFHRVKEKNHRMDDYRWEVYADGIPQCMKVLDTGSLPSEVQFSWTRDIEFKLTAAASLIELKLEGLANCKKTWKNLDALDNVFWDRHIPDYVQQNWKEDEFFAYQFLNGVNPMVIRRCTVLPENFPVTDDMLSLCEGSLADEMQRGNIFLSDYKNLDGLDSNVINGKKQYLMAPLVLLHKTPEDKLMPVAIQLKQTPADDNPVFFPDDEYDWLMAKIFVRSADYNEHQLNFHLLRTHLLAEVFSVSLLRNVPMVHPLYKLLIPHTRYTLQINFLARKNLISKDGVFNQIAAAGGNALIPLLQRSMSSLTYSSLCIKEDIAERGLESVPNFYYRDDGVRLWDIIYRFVHGVISHFYNNDAEVQEDCELQRWILDIFEHGFLSQAETGIPYRFLTVAELIKFVTMVIFTCSAQHSAVNNGQYDYSAWMPNAPSSLQLPPPTTKGTTNEATMLKTLPDINTTVNGMATLWLLSKHYYDFVQLGRYPEEHFSEETPRRLIREFQGELEQLSKDVRKRNKNMGMPYKYLDPTEFENSVGI